MPPEPPASAVSPIPAPAPRLRMPKLAQKLVAELGELIRSGKLVAGARLPTEHAIMRTHGVSRAVVREAISCLQAGGLVEARQGIGTFVMAVPKTTSFRVDPATIVSMGDVIALLDLRISLETEAAYLAAKRRTAEQLAFLLETWTAIERRLEESLQTSDLDFSFHRGIAAATGNRYFSEIIDHLGSTILPRTRIDVRFISGNNVRDYLGRSNAEHRQIYDAIERQDGEAARAAMRVHLMNSRDRLQQLYTAARADTPAP